MAEEKSNDDRTEEPTEERREEFRKKGQIAVSKEITSVFVLASSVVFLTFFLPVLGRQLCQIFVKHFESISGARVNKSNILDYAINTWTDVLYIILPLFAVSVIIATGTTFAQTRLNWSWKRMKPDFSRMNILKGVARMVSGQALVELVKGVGKLSAVGLVAYLILFSEFFKVPSLINYPVIAIWGYWGKITQYLFWSVSGLLLFVAAFDYTYNFITTAKKMRMTKQEVKEEFKKREVDPHVKGRIRRLQREIATRKVLEDTKQATVVITNPTHFAIALKYELGMPAPMVVAKGVDFLALKMREVATEFDIPIIENKPLARTLYKIVEVGDIIPESLYKAVSEVLRYVFKLKGINLNKKVEV